MHQTNEVEKQGTFHNAPLFNLHKFSISQMRDTPRLWNGVPVSIKQANKMPHAAGPNRTSTIDIVLSRKENVFAAVQVPQRLAERSPEFRNDGFDALLLVERVHTPPMEI